MEFKLLGFITIINSPGVLAVGAGGGRGFGRRAEDTYGLYREG